jgi:hypothetical protein
VALSRIARIEDYLVSYSLLDVNGDGRRDLIIERGDGGSGQCSDTGVMLRRGNYFITPDNAFSFEKCGTDPNKEVFWVRLKNRVYVAYKDGAMGNDTVTLLRPFHPLLPEPTLYVRYRYEISKICDSEHKLFCDALEKEFEQNFPHAGMPLCPIPNDVTDKEERYHYEGEQGVFNYASVTRFPLWLDGGCHVFTWQDLRGAYYRDDGLSFRLGVFQARKNSELVEWGNIGGEIEKPLEKIRRSVISIETRIK